MWVKSQSLKPWETSGAAVGTAVGVLETAVGLSGIPDKWRVLRDLPIENRSINGIYPELIQWDDIIDATVEAGKWNVLEHGGRLENSALHVPYQTPAVPPLEQTSWEEPPERRRR